MIRENDRYKRTKIGGIYQRKDFSLKPTLRVKYTSKELTHIITHAYHTRKLSEAPWRETGSSPSNYVLSGELVAHPLHQDTSQLGERYKLGIACWCALPSDTHTLTPSS